MTHTHSWDRHGGVASAGLDASLAVVSGWAAWPVVSLESGPMGKRLRGCQNAPKATPIQFTLSHRQKHKYRQL